MKVMDMKLTLPDEIIEALGPNPEREALEGVLLLLVGEGRLSLERAGVVLGFEDSKEAERWYVERARARPEPVAEDPAWLGEIVHFEDLTQEELDRMDRYLKIRPAQKGSGLSEVSINHDKYLYGDA
ncbi:MAG: hypothetical protein ACR2HO_07615 [Rubrobacteraceae bacterium]|nr:hypothetical protein [Rubrobacter sp.]